MLRDYFPKGTDLSLPTAEHLLAVENELGNRPWLVLNGRTPAQLFTTLLACEVRPCCDLTRTRPVARRSTFSRR